MFACGAWAVAPSRSRTCALIARRDSRGVKREATARATACRQGMLLCSNDVRLRRREYSEPRLTTSYCGPPRKGDVEIIWPPMSVRCRLTNEPNTWMVVCKDQTARHRQEQRVG